MKAVAGKLFPSLQVRKLGLAAGGGGAGKLGPGTHQLVVMLRSGDGIWPGIPYARSKVLASKV